MTGLELIKKYPLAAKVIKDWFLTQMIESLKNDSIDEEFKNFMREQGVEDDKMGTLIELNPRMLFDVFDSHELHIEILVMYSDKPSIFTYTVVEGDLVHTEPTKYDSRIEAEKVAIEKAFEILNDKLCQIK